MIWDNIWAGNITRRSGCCHFQKLTALRLCVRKRIDKRAPLASLGQLRISWFAIYSRKSYPSGYPVWSGAVQRAGKGLAGPGVRGVGDLVVAADLVRLVVSTQSGTTRTA